MTAFKKGPEKLYSHLQHARLQKFLSRFRQFPIAEHLCFLTYSILLSRMHHTFTIQYEDQKQERR